jgi:hypothetical protein
MTSPWVYASPWAYADMPTSRPPRPAVRRSSISASSPATTTIPDAETRPYSHSRHRHRTLMKAEASWGCCDAPSSGGWAGWKPTTRTCASRSGRWRGRRPGGGGSTSAPWCWTRRAGCWPNSARSPPIHWSGRCGAPPPRSWTATGASTAWSTTGRRSMRRAGWAGRGGRPRRLPQPPRRADQTPGLAGRHSLARGQALPDGGRDRPARRATAAQRDPAAAERRMGRTWRSWARRSTRAAACRSGR